MAAPRSRTGFRLIVPLAVAACHAPPASHLAPPGDPLEAALEPYFEQDYEQAVVELEALIREDPDDPVPMGWLTEALYRMSEPERATEVAHEALALDPCNAIALHMLGKMEGIPSGTLEPGAPRAHLEYFERAVRCHPDDGNAWLSLWMSGLVYGETDRVHEAIGRIVDIGFIPPAPLALGRWLLETTPPGGVLFLNGDWDYFPAAAVQVSEGIRPDVRVVLLTLLNRFEPVGQLMRDTGLPPLTEPVFRELQEELGMGERIQIRPLVLAHWVDAVGSGEVTRPLTVPGTAPEELFERPSIILQWAGPGRVVRPAGTDSVSFVHLRRGTDAIPARAFSGPLTHPSDRSPVRRATHAPADHVLITVGERALLAQKPDDRDWAVSTMKSLVAAEVLSPDRERLAGRWMAELRIRELDAPWRRVSTARGGVYRSYLDPERVEELGDGRHRVWFLRLYALPREDSDGTPRDERRWQSEVDCVERRLRTLWRVDYLDGEVVKPLREIDLGWYDATPGSVQEAMLESVCG